MKKTTLFLALMLAAVLPAWGQSVTIASGTVADSSSLAYSGGSLVITQNGFVVPPTLTLNTAGKFSATLAQGSGYTFTVSFQGVNPPLGTGPQTCVAANQTLSGSTQTISFTCPSLSNVSGGGGTPGGSTTQLQFNNGGAFGGTPDFTFDGTHTLTLGASGILTLASGATLNGVTLGMLPSGVGLTANRIDQNNASTTSAQFFSVISDETGTGAVVGANGPTLIAPALGTPASGVATNLTGLPLGTGVTGTLPVGNAGLGVINPTAHGVLVGEGTSAVNPVTGSITGQVFQAVNAADPQFASQGIPWGNGGAKVTTTPYTVLCDTTTAVRDRGTTIVLASGAGTVTVPDPTTTGCGSNMMFAVIDDGGGSITVNRTTTATFSIANGSTNTDAATTFTMSNGQYATFNSPDNTNWIVRISSTGTGTVTVVSAGSLTSTAIVTGGGTTTLQTPSATSTLSSGGNMSLAGTLTTGGSGAGATVMTQGAAQGHATANTVTLEAPAAVTAYEITLPAAAATGIPLWTNTSNVVAETISATVPVAQGGTALASGTSGGILGYTATGTLASSVALTSNILVKGGGAGATPTNSLVTDNGTSATYTGTGGYIAPKLTSNVATGTAPLVITSTTTVPNLTVSNHPKVQFCGTAAACSATAEVSGQVVYGSAPLASGAPSTVTITGISPAFTATADYVCTVSAPGSTAATALLGVTNVSASSFTITGPASVTTVVSYICVGF